MAFDEEPPRHRTVEPEAGSRQDCGTRGKKKTGLWNQRQEEDRMESRGCLAGVGWGGVVGSLEQGAERKEAKCCGGWSEVYTLHSSFNLC